MPVTCGFVYLNHTRQHGLGHGLFGAAVAAWPAVALVGSYELLMMIIGRAQAPAPAAPDAVPSTDPLHRQAVLLFAEDLAAHSSRR